LDAKKAIDEADLYNEGRDYLFNERREQEQAHKEKLEEEAELERERLAEEYVEQYYGKDYYTDLAKYPLSTEQRFFTLQKFVDNIPGKTLA